MVPSTKMHSMSERANDDDRSRAKASAWLVAAWMGAIAGFFDASAGFLHPVSDRLLLFSPLVYGLFALVVYLAARVVLRLLSALMGNRVRYLRHIESLALGVTAGTLVLFFGVYFVTTSTVPVFGSLRGLLMGFVGAAILGLVALVLVSVLSLRRYRTPPGDREASSLENRTAPSRTSLRSWLLATPLLAIVLAYGILAGIYFARDGRLTGGQSPQRGFVLVSLDAARGDHLTALGYPRPTTPEIDELISGGTAFRHAYVQIPASAPGHSSMLSGLPPLSHGVLVNTGVLNDRILTLAERLRGEGFHTAAFINNYYLESRFGFDQGFETFIDQYRATRLTTWDPRLLLRGTALYHAVIRATRRPGARSDDTINLTLDWLRNRPAGDFFVFLHIMDPHAPYAPPEDLRRKFQSPQDDEDTHPVTGERLEPVRDDAALRARIDALTPREINGMRNLYDGDLALADRKVGRLAAELRRLGLFDSTLLIVTADHGEVLYEKEHDFDHGFIWNGDLHVPLVMSYPGHVPAGKIVDEAVPGAAIAATACALLDVPYEEQTGAAFYGPLLPANPVETLAASSPPSTGNEEKIVCALAGLEDGSRVTAAMGPRYKLILWPDGRSMLYDLQHDPFELTDLWPPRDPDQIEAAQRLREHLSTWLGATQAHAIGESRQEDEIDRETRRRLRSLGYVH